MSKLSILILGIFAASLCSVKAMSRDDINTIKGEMLQYFSECNKQFGVTDNDLQAAKDQNNYSAMAPCLIRCVLEMAQILQNNVFQFDMMIEQVNINFPDEMKESSTSAINQCRGVEQNPADLCQASFNIGKCLYEANPTNFLFV